MSELGNSVGEAIRFLRGFFGDVSKLIAVVEDEMTGARLVSPSGNNSTWGFSYSYTEPSRWVANYIARQYVEAPQEGAKGNNVASWYTFFVVHFVPQPLGEPAAIWGTATLNTAQNVWTSLGSLVLTQRGPKFLNRLPVEDWITLREPGQDVREMRYQARALVELRDESTVQQVVTQPLVELVEKVRQESAAR